MAVKIQTNDDYGSNFGGISAGDGPCVICGKSILSAEFLIHVHDGGDLAVTENEAATMDSGADMGMQPIGATCLSYHPELLSYVHRVDGAAAKVRPARIRPPRHTQVVQKPRALKPYIVTILTTGADFVVWGEDHQGDGRKRIIERLMRTSGRTRDEVRATYRIRWPLSKDEYQHLTQLTLVP